MKRAFTLVEILVFLALVTLLAAILWPVFMRPRENVHRYSCQSNLKQIGLGFIQYVQDYNEKFPSARVTASTGWADVLLPYIKSTQLFRCPAAPMAANGFSSDYFYNRNLARAPYNSISEMALTIMSGDGADNAPTWNSISLLPPAWTATPHSPSLRHLDAAYYLFADGHVKSLKPDDILNPSSKPDAGYPSFAIR
jgi:prepilin-type processing-associated H-X9-DG protein